VGNSIPLAKIPLGARDVCVQWVVGGMFYVVDFVVSKRELEYNIDLPVPGKKGGTHRTRYFGKLEGVKDKTKQLAQLAAEASGKTLHAWLDQVVREAAERQAAGQKSENTRSVD
jgi:hypothetical protein